LRWTVATPTITFGPDDALQRFYLDADVLAEIAAPSSTMIC
jgi:hypothetical protein